MTVSKEQVRAKVNASVAALSDADIEAAICVASALVNEYAGEDFAGPVELLDRATFVVAVEQINQDKAPNGIVNQAFVSAEGDSSAAPIRIGRDPMKPAYPILDPWVSGKFFCA